MSNWQKMSLEQRKSHVDHVREGRRRRTLLGPKVGNLFIRSVKITNFNLSEQDKSWLACLIDTEGSVGSPHGLVGISVFVFNTCLPLLEKAKGLTAGTIQTYKKPNEVNGFTITRKTIYRWSVSGQSARGILKAVLPYLVVKREKVRSFLVSIGVK